MIAWRRFAFAALVLSLTFPLPARAHLLSTGCGSFYDGLAHVFVTPQDLLPVLALALLAGLRGPRAGRVVVFVLPAAWLVAGTTGQLLTRELELPGAVAAMTIALGALVAADRRLPLGVVAGLAVALAFLNGGVDGSELASSPSGPVRALGLACALYVIMSLLAGQVASVRAAWARVAVRVAGSWIAAAGLLMLGWSIRRP
jgi:urease accessory protein